MTEHEADIERMKRGPHDLEERIDQLEKQKELLKSHCKKAGDTIKKLEDQISRLKGDIERQRQMARFMSNQFFNRIPSGVSDQYRDLLKNQNKFYTSTSERNRILNISGDATSSQTNN